MGIPEEIAECDRIIANANAAINKASQAKADLIRAGSGKAEIVDGGELPLEPVQVERYQAKATATIQELKALKLDAAAVADTIDPIDPVVP